MNLFGWFKNDLKDIDGGGESNEKEINSLVKEYGEKVAKGSSAIGNKLKEEMSQQNQKRQEKREDKKNSGDLTSDDISKNRKKILWKYAWYAVLITIVGIIITALFRMLMSDTHTSVAPTKPVEILEGIGTEDEDYFQSRVSKQMSELAQQMEKMKNEEKEKDVASKAALLEEAKKNKLLEEQIEEMKTRLEEKKKIDDNNSISEMIESKMASIKEQLDRVAGRPSASEVSHGIQPLPSSGERKEDSILVKSDGHIEPITPKEETAIKKKIQHASAAIQDEYEYSDISIETIAVDPNAVDSKLASEKKPPIPPLHIMTGFAKATLITGVDAPTFGGGKANPVPVILSLNTEEIIANGFDSNLEDCMLIGQAFGNMNTMRAEIEVTRISCNIQNNGVLYKVEEAVKAWVYGENGIHGVKGRLVDSAGKTLTREMAVGFLQGVATAFAQPQTSIQTAAGIPTQVFESGNLQDSAARGAGQGVASGLNSLSNYYTKLLDGAYPFISVRSGRNVTVLFKGGEDVKMTPYSRVDVTSDNGDEEDIDAMEVDINGW